MRLVPGLDTYSYHLHADAWERLAPEPWGMEQLVDKAVKLGLKAVQSADMRHFEPFRSGPDWDEKAVSALRESLEQKGVELELGTGGFEPAHLEQVVRLAELLEVRVLRTFIGGGAWCEEEETGTRLDAAALSFKRIHPLLEEHDVLLAVENHQDLDSVALERFIRELGLPRVGVCLDTGNPLGVIEEPLAAARRLAPFTFTLHLKDYHVVASDDGYALVGAVPGDGVVPLRDILALVRSEAPGYAGAKRRSAGASPRERLQVNLECAVEYIPVSPQRSGWRPEYAPMARTLLRSIEGADSPAARVLAASLLRYRREGDVEGALEMEERMVRQGAERLGKLVRDP